MAALQRCMNCGHTADLSLTNFVCPSCDVQLELLPGEMATMSIALCTLKGASYNHVWRFVTALISSPLAGKGKAIWQCDDCHRIVEGRGPNLEEAKRYSAGEDVHVQSVEIPT